MNRVHCYVAVACALALAPRIGALDPESAARWREDLAFVHRQILDTHPDPGRRRPVADLEADLAALEARLPHLAPHEAVVALAEAVASIGDGHTRLTLPIPAGAGFVEGHAVTELPSDPLLRFHTLPIRFGIYDEGVYVERVEARHAELVGARLLEVGGVQAEEALHRLAPVIRHDNPSQLLDLLPMHLAIPEILASRGLAGDRRAARFGFELAEGGRRDVELVATADEEAVVWKAVAPGGPRKAPSWRHLAAGKAPDRSAFDVPFWLDRIDGGRALFVQYNRCADGPDETVAAFANRLRGELARGGFERLILDLRWNWGGDHSLDQPLLHALIAHEERLGPGAFFVLVGRGTFSAAMMLAVDLERHLRPVFVGEPTGSSPNHFGDSRRFRLPGSGLTLRISTLDWRHSHPSDVRRAIAPHLAVAPKWRALLAGEDPALAAALAGAPAESLAPGTWTGILSPPGGEMAIELRLERGALGELSGALRLEGLPEELPLSRIEERGGSLRITASSPLGEFEFNAVRVGDRLAGHAALAERPTDRFAFGLERRPARG